jgi:hypothetical protein
MERQNGEQQNEIDARWAKDGESRIDAYNAGLLDDIPIDRVFEELEFREKCEEQSDQQG